MPDEKIPDWARKFSSLLQRTYQSSYVSKTRMRGHLLIDVEPKFSRWPVIKEQRSSLAYLGHIAIYYDLRSRLFTKFKEQQPLTPVKHQKRQISHHFSRRLMSLTVFLNLSLACGSCSSPLLVGNPRPLVKPLPMGGVLPESPTALSPVLPSRMGRKLWFDNQRGTNPLTNLPSTAIQGFCHPLQGKGFLSQGTSGSTHQGRMKYAYDFGVPIGMPVYAMQSGRVIGLRDSYPDKGGRRKNAEKFNFIWLEHSNGVRSAYIHLQQHFQRKIPLKLNDWVKTGQLIGYSGNSGWSTAPHLHVEVHSISDSGFGQTLPFVIASSCYTHPFAKASPSS